jgi:small subunit ribosomal protein S6
VERSGQRLSLLFDPATRAAGPCSTELVGPSVWMSTGGVMRDYELMTIHRPDLGEDDVEAKIGEIEAFLTNSEAEVAKRDLWGKRRFAYEIDHLSEGYYSVVSFKAGADAIAGVDRMLSLADEVVRHKIVRLDD